MCKFYKYSVLEVELTFLSLRVTAIHYDIRPWIVISLKLPTELVIFSGKCV